jgi:hypothetical protein
MAHTTAHVPRMRPMDSSSQKKTAKNDTSISNVKQQLSPITIRKHKYSKTYSEENMLSSNVDGMPRTN